MLTGAVLTVVVTLLIGYGIMAVRSGPADEWTQVALMDQRMRFFSAPAAFVVGDKLVTPTDDGLALLSLKGRPTVEKVSFERPPLNVVNNRNAGWGIWSADKLGGKWYVIYPAELSPNPLFEYDENGSLLRVIRYEGEQWLALSCRRAGDRLVVLWAKLPEEGIHEDTYETVATYFDGEGMLPEPIAEFRLFIGKKIDIQRRAEIFVSRASGELLVVNKILRGVKHAEGGSMYDYHKAFLFGQVQVIKIDPVARSVEERLVILSDTMIGTDFTEAVDSALISDELLIVDYWESTMHLVSLNPLLPTEVASIRFEPDVALAIESHNGALYAVTYSSVWRLPETVVLEEWNDLQGRN